MSDAESRSLLNDLKKFDGQSLFDLGHPLLNRVTESFVKAAGIGAVQAVSRDSYCTAAEGFEKKNTSEIGRQRRQTRFPNLEGETYKKSLETLGKYDKQPAPSQWLSIDALLDLYFSQSLVSIAWAKTTNNRFASQGSSSIDALLDLYFFNLLSQFPGLAAGMYSGVTYTLKEVRGGVHDWKNAAVAGALTGATLALTHEEPNYDHIVQGAIAGAALSTAANVLNKML